MRIREEIPNSVVKDFYNIFERDENLEIIISVLQEVIIVAASAGYTDLRVGWRQGYRDRFPILYGYREETEDEQNVRLKEEQGIKERDEIQKQKAIARARAILKKYGAE